MWKYYNIIPKIKQITGKRYLNLEKAIKSMSELELREFSRMLQDIDYELTNLKKKIRTTIFMR